MDIKYLIPNKFKRVGWLIMIPSGFLLSFIMFFDEEVPFIIKMKVFVLSGKHLFGDARYLAFEEMNIVSTLLMSLFMIGCLFVAFSKEKFEDEFISKIRLESLLWAVLVNYILLFIAILFIYEWSFLLVLLFNIYTTLLLFIIKFNLVLRKVRKGLENEE